STKAPRVPRTWERETGSSSSPGNASRTRIVLRDAALVLRVRVLRWLSRMRTGKRDVGSLLRDWKPFGYDSKTFYGE
ncbi:biotrophy-associated secreted protein 2, partial [Colletotrichum higginsianum]